MGLRLTRWFLVIAVLAFAGTAKADTVAVDGSYSFAVPPYGIPPYGGTLNGQSESFYCVDFSTPISALDSWNVTITNLTGSNFSSTKLGVLGSMTARTDYLTMAYLITEMMGATSQSQKAAYQFAIWSFTGGPNQQTNGALVAAALAAVQSGFTGQGFEILTPIGSKGQEFLIYVPEPSVLLMLGIGLIALVVLSRKRLVS